MYTKRCIPATSSTATDPILDIIPPPLTPDTPQQPRLLAAAGSNKQIAINTLFLYGRMIVLMGVNLYTVRLLWNLLGVDNYGIYNVVGGIVLMFTFLKNTMVATSQRFISFELGRGDADRLRRTFSMSVTVHFLLAMAVLVLAETVGLWFLNARMNIPDGRMTAANWVYQCSIFSFIFTIISVPYNAAMVAHEHMKIYGYMGIMEGVLKLLIVLFTYLLPWDRLIVYTVLVLLVSIALRITYTIYCKRHFEECTYRRVHDRHMMHDMFSFAGWSFLGSLGMSVRDQGLNIVLNLFFNVAINAAKGIANQVGTTINGFASNFTMALNPQITKRYAAGDTESMMALVYNGCKLSLILMSIVVVPLIFAADTALRIWLGHVAPYTVGFLQLVLILSLVDCVVSPITTSLQATGKIRKFQIIICAVMVANIPLAWIWLKLDLNPYVVMFVSILTSVVTLISRLLLLRELVRFFLRRFFVRVYARTVPYLVVTIASGWGLIQFFPENIYGLAAYLIVMMIAVAACIYLIALNNNERQLVTSQIRKKLHRN